MGDWYLILINFIRMRYRSPMKMGDRYPIFIDVNYELT